LGVSPEVTVGSVDTQLETITDTVLWGISGGVEASLKYGGEKAGLVKTTWETSISTIFNAKLEKTHSTTATSTCTTNTAVKLLLPANRINLVHQMVFKQRTTLPYTARVRVVPRLRFQNGFTKWGGGGSYRENPETSAIKEKCKVPSGPGGRQFRDFEFNRCDEIRDDARSNADPWEVRQFPSMSQQTSSMPVFRANFTVISSGC